MSKSRRRRPQQGKALTPASVQAVGGRVTDPSDQITAMTRDTVPQSARLLPRPPEWAGLPFGPGMPLAPSPIDPLSEQSGRPAPRIYEYPVTWNISGLASKHTPWATLRNAADGVPLFRRCIEIIKELMTGLDWDVTISQSAIESAQRKEDRASRTTNSGGNAGDNPGSPPPGPSPSLVPNASAVPADGSAVSPAPSAVVAGPGPRIPTTANQSAQPGAPVAKPQAPQAGKVAVEDRMRERLEPAIDKAVKFLATPDRGNGLKFSQWLSQLLEEVLVLDALAIYPRYTRDGSEVWSLEIVDGSTIKPLLDERGGRPLPPFPAYQQILYGFPRGEFTADAEEGQDGEPIIAGGYPSDQLLYHRRVTRVWSPYGLSAVEQALEDGALYIKRLRWMMDEYDQGVSVAGLYQVDGEATWMQSPGQLIEYERAFNAVYSGQTANRQGLARFLPPGVTPVEQGLTGSDAIAEKYKPDYDLYLIKLLASHFGVTLPELGFTDAAAGGLGASGYHEGQEAVQMRHRRPIIRYVEEIITGILHDQLDAPDELCFKFLGLDDEDDPAASDVDAKRQSTGVLTLNEMRDKIGYPRYDFPEADMPLLVTARGIEMIEGASTTASQGFLAPPQAVPPAPPGQSGAPAPGSEPKTVPTASTGAPTQPNAAKRAEITAYRKFAAKSRGRAFHWEQHTPEEAEAIVKAERNGGGARPKAWWPGWARDLKSAAAYEPAISLALIGAVGAQTLTRRWSDTHRHVTDRTLLAGWMDQAGLTTAIEHALTGIIHSLWTEGYLIGVQSSEAVLDRFLAERHKAANAEDELDDAVIDWGSWEPGDLKAAQSILNGLGGKKGLAKLIKDGDLTIKSIAGHRVDELARVLAQAAEEGWANQKTSSEIRALLTRPAFAHMIAVTEVSRASSAASLDRYRANGVEGKDWMSAEDQRVCPECTSNEQEGTIPLDAYFQDGNDTPPGHPTCRCAIAPGWLTAQDAAARGGDDLVSQVGATGLSDEEDGFGATEIGADGEELDEVEAEDAADWDDEIKAIEEIVSSGEYEVGDALGGMMADTRRVVTSDGRTLVRKILKDPYAGADETEKATYQRDAEVLGSRVARAFGFDAPAIATRGEGGTELWMEFMRGQIAADAGAERDLLMRAMDVVMSNKDRNDGNWLVDQATGRRTMIDHGLAFQPWSLPEIVPSWAEDDLAGLARDGKWISNDLDPAQLKEIKKNLEDLESAFDALDRGDWIDDAVARLDVLIDYAGKTAPTEAEELTGVDALLSAPLSVNAAQERGELSELERLALTEYRGSEFLRVNQALRADKGELDGLDVGAGPLDVRLRPMIDNIDSAMARSGLGDDVVTWRGARDGDKIFGAAWGSLMTGAEWTEYGYLSTSADAGWAERFAQMNISKERFTLEIHVPAGTGAVQLSGNSYESELLLQRGLRLRVRADSGPGTSPRRIVAEVVRA